MEVVPEDVSAETWEEEAAPTEPPPPTEAGLTCSVCEGELSRCEMAAQDGADLNACLDAFARCYVQATGTAIPCPDPARCGSCATDSEASDDLIRASGCVLVVENVPEAARCP